MRTNYWRLAVLLLLVVNITLGGIIMAWTAPTTRIVGEFITAPIWNTDIVDNLTFLYDAANPKYRIANAIPFGSASAAAGFTLIEDAGAGSNVTPGGAILSLLSENTDVDALVRATSGILYAGNYTAGLVIRTSWFIILMSSVSNVEAWIAMHSTVGAAPPVATDRHFGFFISGADIYATNADGTTQTINDTTVDLVAGRQIVMLTAEYTVGTSVKYYINGTLVNTHTTHLPDYTANGMFEMVSMRAKENASKMLGIAGTVFTDIE